MPKRKHQRYNQPKKMFDIAVIKSENELMKRYGLKSRREVWRADFEIGKIRDIAKTLITAEEEKKKEFSERQAKKGFSVSSIQDVLALNKEDRIKRRLQSIVTKKFSIKPTQARQMITHKHVKVLGKKMNSPSHLTTIEEESDISMESSIPQKNQISEEEKEILNKMKNPAKEQKENE